VLLVGRGDLRLSSRRSVAVAFACLLFAACARAAPACVDSDELTAFITSRYGDAIEFDVLRNGKQVGEHVTRFEFEGNAIRVDSRMRLDIRILLVPVYAFTYESRARWCGDGLLQLDARVDDNGEERRTQARREADALVVRHGDRTVRAGVGLLPTNHWNPRVVAEREVLNTLTGNVNAVTIAPCARGEPAIERAAPGSFCYAYSGDLDTRVWYDDRGRWSGLAFAGSDGSEILYVCRSCTAPAI